MLLLLVIIRTADKVPQYEELHLPPRLIVILYAIILVVPAIEIIHIDVKILDIQLNYADPTNQT